uniref:Suppressor of forked domain-containing protein n=1 Tax=Leersia perrieri TaxID=77586 RepID=A0A0D9XIM9_9ORYZ
MLGGVPQHPSVIFTFRSSEWPRASNGSHAARACHVKNKAPAPIQLTAEQLLREAREIHGHQDDVIVSSKRRRTIADADELNEHRLERRSWLEATIRRAGSGGGNASAALTRYDGIPRPRRYAQFEARGGRVAHARNVFDRAVATLPRVDRIWLEYVGMEDRLGAARNARQVFDRWMAWQPDAAAWDAYAAFELRHGEIDRARAVPERHVDTLPTADAFIRFAEFQTKQKNVEHARRVYEHAGSVLAATGDGDDNARLLAAFAEFEERCGESDRARAIYHHALGTDLPERFADELRGKLLSLEKRFGDRDKIEDGIVAKRRSEYENAVSTNPFDYDAWFDLIRLEEEATNGDKTNRIRDLYKRAVANAPRTPAAKRHWRRYIYLWIKYALFEELDAKDVQRARAVYRECLATIPHKKFSFSKIWIMAAELEIRDKNIAAARRILGNAISVAPRPKLFRRYIEIELQLGNVGRSSSNTTRAAVAWRSYAALEKKLGETDRARAVYDLAVDQPALDTPELVWSEYIQFELDAGELDMARQLYERLLGRTKHVNVWVSYAEFEATASSSDVENAEDMAERVRRCRAVFQRADEHFRACSDDLAMKEARAMLVREWMEKEAAFGDLGDVELVEKKAPRRVKRKRSFLGDGNGGEGGSEECFDYIFGDEDDVTAAAGFKLLKAAYEWRNSGHAVV